MEENRIILKRLGNAVEAIHDLPSGHVGPELIKVNAPPPRVSEAAMARCRNGDEVSVDKDAYQRNLVEMVREHGTHAVCLPKIRKKVGFVPIGDAIGQSEPSGEDFDAGSEKSHDTACVDSDSSDGDYVSSFLMEVTKNSRPLRVRSRAAPFYQELAPGWRARARDLAPPFARDALHDHFDKAMATDPIHGMEASLRSGMPGNTQIPSADARRSPRKSPRTANKHLENAKRTADRSRPERIGDESCPGGSNDSCDTSREDTESEGSERDDPRSVGDESEGFGPDEAPRTPRRMHQTRSSVRAGSPDTPRRQRILASTHTSANDQCHQRRCGNTQVATYQLGTGSDSEREWSDSEFFPRFKPDGCSGGGISEDRHPSQAKVKGSLYRWAVNVVSDVTDRSKTRFKKSFTLEY